MEGFIPAVLATLGLRELYRVSEKYKLPIYPIIGTGFCLSAEESILKMSVTASNNIPEQNHHDSIGFSLRLSTGGRAKAIEFIKESCANPQPLRFEDSVFEQLQKTLPGFQNVLHPSVEGMAPWINALAAFVPKRRERVQHVGLLDTAEE